MHSSRLILLFSFFFLAHIIIAKTSKNIFLKHGFLSNDALPQLVIIQPTSQTVLVANQTASLLIDVATKSFLLKAFKKATDSTTTQLNFVCGGVVVFSVNSTLGVLTDFTVNPSLIGSCELVAIAPDNPNEFAPSAPVVVVVQSPVYYEGIIDTVLYTDQTIDNFLRAADNAEIQVTLKISCDSGAQVVENVYWTNQHNYYKLPSQLIGECTFSTPVVPINYVPIEPFTISIEPNILFIEPTENQQYIAGSPIVAKLTSTNGGNPEVAVTLTCNYQVFDTQTKSLKSSFIFGPTQSIYGNCVLSVETSEPYYSESTVNISILSTLTFKSPRNDQYIGAGTEYKLEVEGSSGNGIIKVAVLGKCEIGGNFEETVTLDLPKQVIMGEEFSGKCVLTASVLDFTNYPQAITDIVVFPVLTPGQSSKYASYFLMSGCIYSMTMVVQWAM